MTDDYNSFLAGKVVSAAPAGLECDDAWPLLFPWQRDVVRWALRQGRAAVFAGCGLGKTAMQLAWADAVARHAGRPVLVLCPLAVAPQTRAEGEKFGVAVTVAKTQGDVAPGPSVAVTNYQKLLAGHFDPAAFAGVVLDESSILKSYMGKTKRLLVESFAATPYRLCCTATPAPNDFMELGNHSQFLGIMDSDEMLGRWFIGNQQEEGYLKVTYRLKGHAEADYWRWVASWAACIDSPSDLGHPDDGFLLPPCEYHQHVVSVDMSGRDLAEGSGQRLIVPVDKLTATTIHKEMRLTAASRAAKVAALVNANGRPWVVWCNTDYEADALTAAIPDAVEVRGSHRDGLKEERLLAFTRGECRVLVTKPSIAGFGLNWQHCRDVAFVGLSYSHEQFYQAVRRCWRFGQAGTVNVHVVIAETEGEVLASLKRKEADNARMRAALVAATRAGLGVASRSPLVRPPRDLAVCPAGMWANHLGDNVEAMRDVGDASVGLSVFSPPFAGLYIYSDALQDMGNCADDAEFFRHYAFLAPELLRVTVPGRLCVVHCKDLPRYAGRDGTAGLKDFPGELVRVMEHAGWSYHSRVTVWKCPVTERERTNNNGLLHRTVKRDTSQARQGMADYLIVFRRPPEHGLMSARPIARPGGIEDYCGGSPPGTGAHPSPYARPSSSDPALAVWQRYAEPVWWDIDQTDTLNAKIARDDMDEKHICPLQLGLIRRVVRLWSLPGDVVLSPFAGVGSEGVVALQEGRRFLGVELKRSYWLGACRRLQGAASQPDLFALPPEGGAE